MQFLRNATRSQWVEWCLLGFLILAVVWRGGKSMDMTWVLTGAVAFIVILTPWKKHPDRVVPLQLWLAVIALFVWTVLSFYQSTVANYGYDEILRTGALGLIFLWAVRYAQREEGRLFEKGLTQFIRVFSIVTLIACGIGVVVYIFQPVNRFVGTFFDYRFHTDYWPNAWANYLLLAWPMVYYWAFSESTCFLAVGKRQGRKPKAHRLMECALRTFVVAFAIGCLFLSYSRGGLIAFSGQLVLWAGLTYMQVKDKDVWKKIGSISAIIIVMSLVLFQGVNMLRADVHEVLSVGKKVTFSADEGISSVSERGQFWNQAIALSFQRPLFGWGPYSFRFVQQHVQKGVLATSDHAHNVFLKYAVDRGWPAALLLMFIIGFVLVKGIDLELRRGVQGFAPFGTLLVVSLTGVISHSLVDYNLQFVGIAFPFWILLGFLAGHVSADATKNVPRALSRYVEVLIACVILVAACIEGGYLVMSSIGRHAEARGDTRMALRWYERAQDEFFPRDLHLSRSKLLFAEGNYTSAEQAVDRYFEDNKIDSRAWKWLGEIHESKKDYKTAVRNYEMAYEYGKYNDIGITLGLVRSYLADGQRNTVDSRKDEFDALLTAYANAIIVNSHFIALSPNVEQFVELCEIFAELYIDESPVYYVLAAKADDHGRLERERIIARPPGFLW